MILKLVLSLALIAALTINFLDIFTGKVKHFVYMAFLAVVAGVAYMIYGLGTTFYFLFVLVLLLSIVSLLRSKANEILAYLILFLIIMGMSTLLGLRTFANLFGTLFYLGLCLFLLRGIIDVKD